MEALWALSKMLQFHCYSKETELVQTKTVASKYYRADTNQGKSKICWYIRKLSTPSTVRQGNCAEEILLKSFMPAHINKYELFWISEVRLKIFFLQGQIHIQTWSDEWWIIGWICVSWKWSNVSISSRVFIEWGMYTGIYQKIFVRWSYVKHPKYTVFMWIPITEYLYYGDSNPLFRN